MNGQVRVSIGPTREVGVQVSRGIPSSLLPYVASARTDAARAETSANIAGNVLADFLVGQPAFPDLSVTLRLADVITKGPWVDIRAFGAAPDDYSDAQMTVNTAAFNAALLSGNKVFITGDYYFNGRINLDLTPHNSYSIEGACESTRLHFVGSGAGFYDKYGSQDNENYHVKSMRNFYLIGDGTNTGFECSSLCLVAENLVFSGFYRGLYLHDGGYSSSFKNCFFRFNTFGVYFGSLVTTVDFLQLYCTQHNEAGGAAIYFSDDVERVRIHGLLQANKSPAIWYGTNFGGTLEIDCYFELNGYQSTGVCAVQSDATAGTIYYRNCKIPLNVSGAWINGNYQLGYDVVLDNCRVTTFINPTNSVTYKDCTIDGAGGVTPGVLATVYGRNKFDSLYGGGGAGGFLFQLPAVIKPATYNLINKQLNPFSVGSASVIPTGATNPPVVSLDTATVWGGYNSTKIAFADNAIGAAGNNCVLLRGTTVGLAADAGNTYIVAFLAKANKPGSVKVNVTGAVATPILQAISLDTSWRKFLFIGANHKAGADTGQAYLWCNSLLAGFEVNITGIVLHENVPKNQELFNTLLEGNFKYTDDTATTFTWDPGSLADGAGETSTAITVPGAALGDFIVVSAPYSLQGITCNGYVSTANTVQVRIQNETGGVVDLASGTWKIKVIK